MATPKELTRSREGMSSVQASTTSQEWAGGQVRTSLVDNSSLSPHQSSSVYRIGIYGWRKRCLYFLVIILFSMVIINLALTIWIIRVMDFSINGMGRLRIFRDGIRLEGRSHFLHTIYAAKIQSRRDQDLKLESSRNITINARNKEGKITNRLTLGPTSMTSFAEKFTIKNRKGETLFQADDKEVVISTERLRVTGSGGIRFQGSVQTPLVTAEPFQQLRLESPTRTLNVKAPEGIGIESRAGDISASCLKDLKLTSKEGSIWLDSERVELRNLKTAIPTTRGRSYPGIYQLCACENGRLFLAPPEKACQADNIVCRERDRD
ncbi:delta-sarcoglycan-like [Argiope bruennichi]|uniref:delta-sarcoglycan-like n=1 Tax=Argiope bruennichi TaxID=94029 RepID=UPI002494CBB2|nr:delta-sarcoglycan-like [Argiope bruennichi]XP_055926843.1 delta-sarcoglycan-like [Argiope bruennichi]